MYTTSLTQIMKDYKLGPNGAILTALNLFLTQPEDIVNKMQEQAKTQTEQPNLFVVDIPGQIEVFTWSSSSLILMAAIASVMPVRIVYIIDSARSRNPNVFLSNILFARTAP
jgi:GPN-loop GTPase